MSCANCGNSNRSSGAAGCGCEIADTDTVQVSKSGSLFALTAKAKAAVVTPGSALTDGLLGLDGGRGNAIQADGVIGAGANDTVFGADYNDGVTAEGQVTGQASVPSGDGFWVDRYQNGPSWTMPGTGALSGAGNKFLCWPGGGGAPLAPFAYAGGSTTEGRINLDGYYTFSGHLWADTLGELELVHTGLTVEIFLADVTAIHPGAAFEKVAFSWTGLLQAGMNVSLTWSGNSALMQRFAALWVRPDGSDWKP